MFDVLVTGGAGYVGSHACVALLNAGYSVIIVDDLSNSRFEVISRIKEITGKKACFYPYDVSDEIEMEKIFSRHNIHCVLHFAGKKAVLESVQIPLDHYKSNFMSTISLMRVMQRHMVKKLVFSSSAAVYGEQAILPFSEDSELSRCYSPYGWSKWMIEQMMKDVYNSDPDWSIVILRYFNPVGAHPSGRMGEDPQGLPNSLFPYVMRVLSGRLDYLPIYGADYNTSDGTGERDYVHVMDLARGQVLAFEKAIQSTGVSLYNMGTGSAHSVLEVIKIFEDITGKKIPCRLAGKREGDIATSFASTSKAEKELGWKATLSLQQMCEDAWRFQKMNPTGY